MKIEWAAGAERPRRDRARNENANLAVRDVDEAMRRRAERRLELRAERSGVRVLGDQEPLVWPKPQRGAALALAGRPELRRQVGPESGRAGGPRRLAAAKDEARGDGRLCKRKPVPGRQGEPFERRTRDENGVRH
jgi:hypothetical protein